MKNIQISIAMLVRQEKNVTVSVPDDFDSWDDTKKTDLMSKIYEADDGVGFQGDNSWGCEEATHSLLGEAPEDSSPQYIADEEGEVKKV